MSEPFDFEGETDMELLGGTFEDDASKDDTEPAKQDESPVVKDGDEKKPADTAVDKPVDDDDPQPKRDAVIPRGRFDEVNAKLHAEREENDRLRAELAQKKPPAVQNQDAVDVDALEQQYFDAMLTGDKDLAVSLRSQINREIRSQAEFEVTQKVASEMTAKEQEKEFSGVAKKAIADYPFLDDQSDSANPQAIAEVIEWHEFFLSKGDSPASALQKAAAKIGPLYAVAENPADDPAPLEDKRKQAAMAVAAKAANSQPPPIDAGVGNRAIPQSDDLIADQNKWDKAPDAERARLLA